MSDAEDDYLGADNGGTHYARPRASMRSRMAALTTTARQRAELRVKQAQEELAQLDAVMARFGAEPAVGTVITFKKRFERSGGSYMYAALRAGGGWYLTGRDGKMPRSWEWVCEFIGDAPYRVIEPEPSTGGGKTKMFRLLFDGQPPTDVVMAVDEVGEVLGFGIDPAVTERSGAVEPRQVKRPGDEFSSFEEVARACRKEDIAILGDIAKCNPLMPFAAFPSADGTVWEVRDQRFIRTANQVKKTFPAAKDGRRRAEQSATDRNQRMRKVARLPHAEPPVGSRVRSKAKPLIWARRRPDGKWDRYGGTRLQSIGLGWEKVCRILGPLEPGSPVDDQGGSDVRG